MPKLLFQGHGSYRLIADDGRVVYVDPSSGKGQNLPADIILVTHQHSDHNKIEKCTQNHGCRIIANKEALANGQHNSFDVDGILIQAVQAKSIMHSSKKCVGYVITIDGISLYASGDTSRTAQMDTFDVMNLDFAIFPGAGLLSMGLLEVACGGGRI